MENQPRRAYLFGIAAVLLWSTVASAFKLSLKYLDPAQLLLYSTLFSIAALGGILAVQGRLGVIFTYTRREYARSLLLGIINPFLYYLVLFKAYGLLPAQVAQPINYTWALTLAFLSIPLLGQKIGVQEITAGLISYLGVAIISTRGSIAGLDGVSLPGVGLALFSTVLWALYWIYNTKDSRDPVAGLLLNFLFGLPFVFVFCLAFSDIRAVSLPGLAGAAYVGLFEMGVTFVLWIHALKYAENTARVGYLIFLSPFLSLVFIRVLVGEEILASTVAGLVLIVAGLVIQHTGASRKRGLEPQS
ncbi:MAG: DMT family transporter [Desulfomonilia bacterium]|jgi:drug/metabolite transporter (DMT)-like permease|nr:DMT family transporter [Deltaproteobacteria bacterium]MDX9762027.1 DMT family transporter [Desulfomonilia bacterium]HPW68521.1 DMT family transporter [Deltaproteobacteria bacterium]